MRYTQPMGVFTMRYTANGSDHHEIHTAIGSGPTMRYTQPMGVITMRYTPPMGVDFHVGDCLVIFSVVSHEVL